MSLPKYKNNDLTNEESLNKAKRKIYYKFKSKVNLLPENEEETLKSTFKPSTVSGDTEIFNSDINNIVEIINKTSSYVLSIKSLIVPYQGPIKAKNEEMLKALKAEYDDDLEGAKADGISTDAATKLSILNNAIVIISSGAKIADELTLYRKYVDDINKKIDDIKVEIDEVNVHIDDITDAIKTMKGKSKSAEEIKKIKEGPIYTKLNDRLTYSKNALIPFTALEREMDALRAPGSEAALAAKKKEYDDLIYTTFKGIVSGLQSLKTDIDNSERRMEEMLRVPMDKTPLIKELTRLTDFLNNKLKVNLADRTQERNNMIDHINLLIAKLNEIKYEESIKDIEKMFGTSDIPGLKKIKDDIIKKLGSIGKLSEEYFRKKNKILEAIIFDSSIKGVKQTKVDTESQLDFDKLIQKILFNYDEINKDLINMKGTISTITQSNFDKLISASKTLKLQIKNLGLVIYNTDGTFKITPITVGGKIRFKDITDNIKNVVNKHLEFEEIVVDLSNNYNPTRTQPEAIGTYTPATRAIKGGARGRTGYVFADLINHMPNRFH
jgi:hypothetical protein